VPNFTTSTFEKLLPVYALNDCPALASVVSPSYTAVSSSTLGLKSKQSLKSNSTPVVSEV